MGFLMRGIALFLTVVMLTFFGNYGRETAGQTGKPSAENAPVDRPGSGQTADEDVRGLYTKLAGDGTDTVTVMVYMVGSDLESSDGCASADLAEICAAVPGERVNILIQTGGAKSWTDARIDAAVCQRWRVADGTLEQVGDAGDVDMARQASLSDFIRFAAETCPANRYCLILWNHGGGTMSGFGYDERYDSEMMSLDEMEKALDDGGVRFDFVGFDACLMATVETAYMLEKYADYMIASAETEPTDGWFYTDWLTALGENPSLDTETLGRRIVNDFVREAGAYEETTLSVVDLRYIPSAYRALCTFFSESETLIDNGAYKTFSVARANAKAYGNGDFEQVDAVDYLTRTELSGAQDVIEKIEASICFVGGSVADSCGLAMYFPYRALAWYDGMHEILDAIGMSDAYISFFDCFVSVMAAGQTGTGNTPFSTGQAEDFSAYAWFDDEAVSGYGGLYADEPDAELHISEKDGGFVLALENDVWEEITGIEVQVYLDNNGGYTELGSDCVFEFDADGDLKIDYDGYWVAINGQIVPFYSDSYDEYDDGSWTNYGYAPCRVNGVEQELVLYWGDECPGGTVLGYRNATDVGGPAAKGVYSLTDGDTLRFYTDRFDYNGTYVQTVDFGREIVVDGELSVSYAYVGDGECVVYYMLTDLFGNCSWTEPVIAY